MQGQAGSVIRTGTSTAERFDTVPGLAGDERAWYAIYVQVNHEKEVAKRLQRKAVDAYLPLVETWSKRRDRRKRIHMPIFPGYVFVHAIMDSHTNIEIVKTPGAVYILKNADGPLIIPDMQMVSLQTVLRHPESLTSHPYLREGDEVRVVSGPFTGCSGILIRQNINRGRLVVSLDIIQQAVSVELNMEDVRPAKQQP